MPITPCAVPEQGRRLRQSANPALGMRESTERWNPTMMLKEQTTAIIEANKTHENLSLIHI